MLWHDRYNRVAETTFDFYFCRGSDGCLYNGSNLRASVDKMLTHYQVPIEGMLKLVDLVKNNQPVFVRINSGARAGSIARLNPKCYQLLTQPWVRFSTKPFPLDPRLSMGVEHTNVYGGRVGRQDGMIIFFNEFVKISDVYFDFDGRKTIQANYSEQLDLEILVDHQGATEFVFTRAKKEDKPEVKNPVEIKPIDMFGQELELDDMFIYARSEELVIAKLKKVNSGGYITAELLMDSKLVRLQGRQTLACTQQGKRNPSLMKFVKNEMLSQKLMLEKLRK